MFRLLLLPKSLLVVVVVAVRTDGVDDVGDMIYRVRREKYTDFLID